MREMSDFFAQTLDFLPIRHFEKYLGSVFLGFVNYERKRKAGTFPQIENCRTCTCFFCKNQ